MEKGKIANFIEKHHFLEFITILIVFNSIILGMKAYPYMMAKYGIVLDAIDDIMVWIFVSELTLYFIAYGPRKCLTDPWYVFDASVILVTVFSFEPAFSSLRALRVLRVLRLITVFPNLRRVVQGLIDSLPGIASIGTLLLIVMYVAGLISNNLFGQSFPVYFGSLERSLFSLFQIMTAESWASAIARPVMDVFPYAWIFFVLFILATTFIVLNLFIAVIVSAMQNTEEHQETEDDKMASLHEIKKLLKKIDKKLG